MGLLLAERVLFASSLHYPKEDTPAKQISCIDSLDKSSNKCITFGRHLVHIKWDRGGQPMLNEYRFCPQKFLGIQRNTGKYKPVLFMARIHKSNICIMAKTQS